MQIRERREIRLFQKSRNFPKKESEKARVIFAKGDGCTRESGVGRSEADEVAMMVEARMSMLHPRV